MTKGECLSKLEDVYSQIQAAEAMLAGLRQTNILGKTPKEAVQLDLQLTDTVDKLAVLQAHYADLKVYYFSNASY